MTVHEYRLSPVEFYACWQALDLGEPPMLLELRSPGHTMAEHHQLLTRAFGDLGARGLADGGRPVPALASLLHLAADWEYQLDIRLSDGLAKEPGPVLGLGSVAGAECVLVISAGGQLRLRRVDRAQVFQELIELAGPITPGIGRPVSIPAELLDEGCASVRDGDLWALADWLVSRGISSADASSLARMCQGITAAGQLGVTGRADGRDRRAPWVIGFHRTDAGHFLQLRRPSPVGDLAVTVCPTDSERLRHLWRELLDQLYVAV